MTALTGVKYFEAEMAGLNQVYPDAVITTSVGDSGELTAYIVTGDAAAFRVVFFENLPRAGLLVVFED